MGTFQAEVRAPTFPMEGSNLTGTHGGAEARFFCFAFTAEPELSLLWLETKLNGVAIDGGKESGRSLEC